MSDDENEPMTVKLRAQDSEKLFEISYQAAKLSDFVANLPIMPDGSAAIELDRVDEVTLEKVVEFLIHHMDEPLNEIPQPLGESSFNDIVDQPWYRKFIQDDVERPMVFDLLTAANYLGISPLLDLAALAVTFDMVGRDAAEIREILNLPDLTPDEEAVARVDHPWVFEHATN